jgi:DNA-binding response OmpR family regulator
MSRVLVVDDDPDIRLLLRLELSGQGHDVVEAGNGEEALSALAADAVDLMLLDLMMPVLDGWGVLQALGDGDGPPIVVITAFASAGDAHVIDLLQRGAVDVVAKPFDLGWLAGLVHAVVLVEPSERDEYRRRRLSRALGGS